MISYEPTSTLFVIYVSTYLFSVSDKSNTNSIPWQNVINLNS